MGSGAVGLGEGWAAARRGADYGAVGREVDRGLGG